MHRTENISRSDSRAAQSAIEYLLLFSVVAIVVLIGFKTLLPRANVAALGYYNKVARGIYGEPPPSDSFAPPSCFGITSCVGLNPPECQNFGCTIVSDVMGDWCEGSADCTQMTVSTAQQCLALGCSWGSI